MEKQLIGRGVLAGAAAGLAAFVFARVFAEPVIGKAIAYESARDVVQARLDRAAGLTVPAAGPDLFSRTVQADVGAGVGLILFGAAMGALVAVAYAICLGRTGAIRPRPLALLVALFGFIGIYAVPFAKYPANPPGIGHADTIGPRGALYLVMVASSCLLLFLAVYVGQRLATRYSTWTASVLTGLAYLGAIAVVMALLPALGDLHNNVVEYGRHATETPLPLRDARGTIVFPGFPADVLAQFRFYSITAQVIVWGVIALAFAPLAERVVAPQDSAARQDRRPLVRT
ncbi:MAG: Cobalt transporter [Marmoricola sp.]|nr:Cobalt transporter [Marmoricola sp.]